MSRAGLRALALLGLAAGVGCGPVAVHPVPDEPVQPDRLPEAQAPRRVIRIHPFGDQPADYDEPASAPADTPLGTRVGTLSTRRCFAELARAGVPFRREQEADDVRNPVRLLGPINGVTYRGQSLRRPPFPSDVLDCRLAVALIELSAILSRHGVVEVVHISLHRESNNGRPVETGGSTGHRGGLAIDAALFRRDDGSTISVLDDWKGRRGAKVCGPHAARGTTGKAQVLREIVCRADRRALFHVLLTPNHDRAHRNHFHMEVRPDGVRWLYLR
jgi:hypothetical protein